MSSRPISAAKRGGLNIPVAPSVKPGTASRLATGMVVFNNNNYILN